jgi:hypothetical protein
VLPAPARLEPLLELTLELLGRDMSRCLDLPPDLRDRGGLLTVDELDAIEQVLAVGVVVAVGLCERCTAVSMWMQ